MRISSAGRVQPGRVAVREEAEETAPDPWSAFTSSISTTLVAPVIGTMTAAPTVCGLAWKCYSTQTPRRCGARSKRTGKPCRDAAMPNGRCKLHGGKSTGAYLHRQVQMVNTSCASRTPLSGCRPTDNNCSRTPCAACTNDMEIRIGVPDSLHNPSRRAALYVEKGAL